MANVFEDLFLLALAIIIIFAGGYYYEVNQDPLWIQVLAIGSCALLVILIGYTLLVEEKYYDGR